MNRRVIPVVDLSAFTGGTPEEKTNFVKNLGGAFHTIGFVGVKGHGIPKELVEAFYRVSKSFFALDTHEKRKYEVPGGAGQRGYTSFGKEHAKQSQVPDLKEFFQFGQYLEEDEYARYDYPRNVSVDALPEFNTIAKQLYRVFEEKGGYLLSAIALYLGLDENYFDQKINKGNSILRTIHYPPITSEPASAIRAEQHEDINLITLLVGASAGGLQLLNTRGEWLDIQPEEDEIVINVGDMLQRLTNNYLKSTTHRVVNPPRSQWHVPRLSLPFFLHPRNDMSLACLGSCVSNENPCQYSPITAGDYLNERLAEIGLKK